MLGLAYLEVVGDSMFPTLSAGDWILVRRSGRARPGQVVALRRPDRPDQLIVKRVARVDVDGYWVLGDNSVASTDSRAFGPAREIVGPLVLRVRPWGRVR